MTPENTSCEFDPHATSMGDEVAPEVYEASLDPEFAEKFLNFIISEVIRHHVRIANERAEQDGEATEAEKSEG